MMKSFFKKLSLVMALAMVVSLVAPAGSAFAAEAGIAYQGEKTAIEAINVEVGGDVVDLCFLGAPADWKSAFDWTSGDETIASVDRAGKVTGLKAGETTVTITAGADGSYKHTVKVTVTEPKAEATIAQLTEIKAKAVFGSKVSFKKEAAELYRIFDTVEGPVEVYWPIDEWKVADDGMSVTFAPYVQFGDGDNYVLRVGSYEVPFTTAIGEVTHVFTTYGTNADANNEIAYITPEEADDEITMNLGVKIYSGTVDLTAIYKSNYDITYEFLGEEPEDGVDLDEDEGTIEFELGIPVQVTAVLTYEDEEGEEQTVANVMPATIAPKPLPEYEIERVVDWAVIPSSETDMWKFSWDNKTVPAGDENYEVVLKMVDNRGDYYVTGSKDTAKKLEDHYNNANVYWTEDCKGTEWDENGYDVEFYSTNTEDFLVHTNGSLATYKKVNAVIYVSLFMDTEDEDNVFVENITAFKLTVGEERELDKVTAEAAKIDRVVDAMDEKYKNDFITATFKLQAYDQYGTKWADAQKLNDNLEDTKFVITGTNPDIVKDENEYVFKSNTDGTATLAVNSNDLFNLTEKSSIKFYVKEEKSGETITLTLSLEKPEWAVTDDEKFVKDEKEDKYTSELLFNVVNSVGVTVEGKDDKKIKKEFIALDTYKDHLDVEISVADKDLGYVNWQDDGNIKNINKYAEIKLYKISDNQPVGYFEQNSEENEFLIISDENWETATADVAVGQKLIAVYDKDDKLVKEGVEWDGNKVTVKLLSNKEGELKYATAGRYSVSVYTVTKIEEDEIKYAERTSSFNVTYGQAAIAYVDQDDIKTDVDFRNATKDKQDTVKEAVLDALSFTINGSDWNVTSTTLVKNVKFTIKGDYVIIHSVEFKVPYDNGTTLDSTEAYYYKTVKDIDKSIKYVED